MSRPTRPSALSDLIRQATAPETSDSTPPSSLPGSSVPRWTDAAQRSSASHNATAEELAEAFFPGSSLREHAFFPKSLTTHSLSHSQFGLLGGARAGQWAQADGGQAHATSPPFGSIRGASGAGGSTATSHSILYRQASTAHASIAEMEGEGEHEGGARAVAGSAGRSGQASTPAQHVSGFGGAASWQPWSRGRSPATPAEGISLLSAQQQQPQQQPSQAEHQPQSVFAAQSHLGLRPHGLERQPEAEQGAAREGAFAALRAEPSDLTEPLLGPGSRVDTAQQGSVTGRVSVPGPVAAIGSAGDAATASAAAGATAASPSPSPQRSTGLFNALVFGMINAVVSMPTLIAYAAIVFKAPLYKPYLDSLCRFFFFSSGVHQLVFVALSTLPFAIGQVQDVGLIFLSAMASDIALRLAGPGERGGGDGGADESVAPIALGSSLLVMTLSTFIVGLLTVVVARLRLADLVSYVPLPVVGGYLGFVGYFCIAGGTALAAGVQVDTLLSWANLFAADPLIKLLPAAATIAALMCLVAHVSHPLALPALLAAIPLAFHGVLWAAGWDLADAQAAGWVMPPTVGDTSFWKLWGLFNLQHGATGVSLPAMLAQAPKLAGLFLVVCFGSCMDVAAIQSDMPEPLDFNRELLTVGVSNMVTGALGAGYTGSYIFSQTVFTMRQGVFNRVNGLVVAAVELVVFALPFSVVQYLPNFYFGALLVWFGIEISRDWLILSYRKLSRPEYVLLWGTFLAIMAWGLELGIAGGVVMATLYFAYQYAQSQVSSLRRVAARSGRTHVYDTSSSLDLLGRRLAVLRLGGFVFFGSSTGLGQQVLQTAARMLQERAQEQRQHEAWALSAEANGGDADGHGSHGHLTAPVAVPPSSASAPALLELDVPANSPMAAARRPPAHVHAQPSHKAQRGRKVAGAAAAAAAGAGPDGGGGDGGDGGGSLSGAEWHMRAAQALAEAPVVLILDFSGVTGLDSTAARTFATLVSTLSCQHVGVLFAGLRQPGGMRQLLEANGLPLRPFTAAQQGGGEQGAGVVSEAGGCAKQQLGVQQAAQRMVAESALVRPHAGGCWEFGSVAAAVRAAEEGYLGLALGCGLLPEGPSPPACLQTLLARHMREVLHSLPHPDPASLVAALEGALTRRRLAQGDVLWAGGAAVREVAIIELGSLVEEEHFEGGVRVGAREHGAGVVVGAPEFFLSRPATSTVRCSSPAAQLLVLSRPALAGLLAEQPAALAALQLLLLRAACMDLSSAQEAANHAAAA